MRGGGTLVWREFAELPESPYLWKKIPNEEIKLHRLNNIYFPHIMHQQIFTALFMCYNLLLLNFYSLMQ